MLTALHARRYVDRVLDIHLVFGSLRKQDLTSCGHIVVERRLTPLHEIVVPLLMFINLVSHE